MEGSVEQRKSWDFGLGDTGGKNEDIDALIQQMLDLEREKVRLKKERGGMDAQQILQRIHELNKDLLSLRSEPVTPVTVTGGGDRGRAPSRDFDRGPRESVDSLYSSDDASAVSGSGHVGPTRLEKLLRSTNSTPTSQHHHSHHHEGGRRSHRNSRSGASTATGSATNSAKYAPLITMPNALNYAVTMRDRRYGIKSAAIEHRSPTIGEDGIGSRDRRSSIRLVQHRYRDSTTSVHSDSNDAFSDSASEITSSDIDSISHAGGMSLSVDSIDPTRPSLTQDNAAMAGNASHTIASSNNPHKGISDNILEFCVTEANWNILRDPNMPISSLIPPSMLFRYPTLEANDTVSNTAHIQEQSFFFPSGVKVEIVPYAVMEVKLRPYHFKRHIVPFTDRAGHPLYACCLTVVQAYKIDDIVRIDPTILENLLRNYQAKYAAQCIQKAFRLHLLHRKSMMWQQLDLQQHQQQQLLHQQPQAQTSSGFFFHRTTSATPSRPASMAVEAPQQSQRSSFFFGNSSNTGANDGKHNSMMSPAFTAVNIQHHNNLHNSNNNSNATMSNSSSHGGSQFGGTNTSTSNSNAGNNNNNSAAKPGLFSRFFRSSNNNNNNNTSNASSSAMNNNSTHSAHTPVTQTAAAVPPNSQAANGYKSLLLNSSIISEADEEDSQAEHKVERKVEEEELRIVEDGACSSSSSGEASPLAGLSMVQQQERELSIALTTSDSVTNPVGVSSAIEALRSDSQETLLQNMATPPSTSTAVLATSENATTATSVNSQAARHRAGSSSGSSFSLFRRSSSSQAQGNLGEALLQPTSGPPSTQLQAQVSVPTTRTPQDPPKKAPARFALSTLQQDATFWLDKVVVGQRGYCIISPLPEYTFLFTVLDAIAASESKRPARYDEDANSGNNAGKDGHNKHSHGHNYHQLNSHVSHHYDYYSSGQQVHALLQQHRLQRMQTATVAHNAHGGADVMSPVQLDYTTDSKANTATAYNNANTMDTYVQHTLQQQAQQQLALDAQSNATNNIMMSMDTFALVDKRCKYLQLVAEYMRVHLLKPPASHVQDLALNFAVSCEDRTLGTRNTVLERMAFRRSQRPSLNPSNPAFNNANNYASNTGNSNTNPHTAISHTHIFSPNVTPTNQQHPTAPTSFAATNANTNSSNNTTNNTTGNTSSKLLHTNKPPTATTPTATTANPPSSKYLLRVRDYGKVLTRDIHSLLTTPEWSLSVLLVHVNAQTLFKIVNLLLMEKSLIIYGRNAGVVTAVTLGVSQLLSPFLWEGIFIPLVPDNARELFGAPVPLIIGTTSPPRLSDVSSSTAVLHLNDDTAVAHFHNHGVHPPSSLSSSSSTSGQQTQQQSSNSHLASTASPISPAHKQSRLQSLDFLAWFVRLPEVSADMPVDEEIARRIEYTRRMLTAHVIRDPQLHVVFALPQSRRAWLKEQQQTMHPASARQSLDGSQSLLSPHPNQNHASQHHTHYLPEETVTVKNQCDRILMAQVPKAIRQQLRTLLACLKRYNATMCGGPVLDDVQQWKRFLRHNSVTQTEEFYPENYMEPLRGKLEFQDAMVHTQLFVSFIDRLRREQRILDQVREFIGHWIYCRVVMRRAMQRRKDKVRFRSFRRSLTGSSAATTTVDITGL